MIHGLLQAIPSDLDDWQDDAAAVRARTSMFLVLPCRGLGDLLSEARDNGQEIVFAFPGEAEVKALRMGFTGVPRLVDAEATCLFPHRRLAWPASLP